MNRREFLKPVAILTLGGLNMNAVSAKNFPKINFHAHAILPSYIDALKILKIDAAARAINEEFAALCKKFPQKFGFAVTLPLPDVEGSIKEFYYATEKLGAIGVKLASNSDGVYLGDETLDPIFAELNKKNSLVIIHPSPARLLPCGNVITGKVMALFEYPADTTRAILNLLANGTLEKFNGAGEFLGEFWEIIFRHGGRPHARTIRHAVKSGEP